jgi:CubicO group peptidase (beta-lactamase class C family)
MTLRERYSRIVTNPEVRKNLLEKPPFEITAEYIQRKQREFLEAGISPSSVMIWSRYGEQAQVSCAGVVPVLERVATEQDFFDIASVTKVITAHLILLAQKEGLLDIAEHPKHYGIPVGHDVGDLSIYHLLTHRSGITQSLKWDKAQDYSSPEVHSWYRDKDNFAINLDRLGKPQYYDGNYIFLGKILSKLYKRPLREIIENFLLQDGLDTTVVFDPTRKGIVLDTIIPTEWQPTQSGERLKHGIVHDEKATWASNGGDVMGHAGLFATGEGLHRLAQMLVSNHWQLPTHLHKLSFGLSNSYSAEGSIKEDHSFGIGGWRSGVYGAGDGEFNISGYTGPIVKVHLPTKSVFVHMMQSKFPRRLTGSDLEQQQRVNRTLHTQFPFFAEE